MISQRFIFTCALLLLLSKETEAQIISPDTAFAPFNDVIGNWFAEVSNDPLEGAGGFTFQFDLDKRILVRKFHMEFPATMEKPKAIHDDLMIIYTNEKGMPDKAIYFDNEGHSINYNVEVPDSGNTIVFTSEYFKKTPRLRMKYVLLDRNNLRLELELGDSDNGDNFRTYLERRYHKH
jgi:hypothetical protein